MICVDLNVRFILRIKLKVYLKYLCEIEFGIIFY